MPTTATAVKRRLSASARRERVEAAAVEVFAGRGYDATTLGEVAAAAGVTRTVLYDHFRSKRALYLHVLASENDAMLARVGAGITGSGEARDRMRATIGAYLGFARERPASRRLLVDPVPTGDDDLDHAVRTFRQARAHAVGALLAPDLVRAGLEPGSPASGIVVDLLITGIDGVARWWEEHPTTSAAEVVDVAARVVWDGLGGLGR